MIKDEVVLKVLALAVEDDTPDHHLDYLLKKLYGRDGLSLDSTNTAIYERIKEIVKISHYKD